MVRSRDEKMKVNENNYNGRGLRKVQSGMAEGEMGRHDATRFEVSPIQERRYW